MPLIDRAMAPESLEALYALVVEEDRKGITRHHRALNWMVLGCGIARAITGQPFREPTWGEYVALVLLVESEDSRLRPVLDFVVSCCPFCSTFRLQELVETQEAWTHPSQILASPRPSMQALLQAYRIRQQEGDRDPTFLNIRERLEAAVKLERSSSQRRQRRKKARRNARVRMSREGRVCEWLLEFVAHGSASRKEILEALEEEQLPTASVDQLLSFLGAATTPGDTPYRFVDGDTHEAARCVVHFLVERLEDGTSAWMSDLAEGARRIGQAGRFERATFEMACLWVVEVVEPEGRHNAAEIRKFAATCWEGVGC